MMVQIYNFFSEQSDKTQKTLYNRIKRCLQRDKEDQEWG